MKLFKLEYFAIKRHCPYNKDILYSGIVRAEDEDGARKVMAENSCDEDSAVWFDHDLVKCKEIQIAGKVEALALAISYGS